MDDVQLVEALQGGDAAAMAELYDRYAARLHAFCTRVLNEPHTADDAVQDTFVLAAARIGQLRDPSALRPWLYAIARNECTRHGRERARAVPVETPETMNGDRFVGDDDAARGAVAADHGELVWAAAEGLDERDRVLLELSVRHGLEGSELAAASGVAAGQISMATGRMRDRLERSLGALLVARKGSRDCGELAALLVGWDGRFSVLVRKRVARHVDRCDICQHARRALVAPFGTLGLAPTVGAFAVLGRDLRTQTLEAMGNASIRAPALAGIDEPWPDGFPPSPEPRVIESPVVTEPAAHDESPSEGSVVRLHRRRMAVLGVAVVVALAIFGGSMLLDGDGEIEVDARGADRTSGAAVSTELLPDRPSTSIGGRDVTTGPATGPSVTTRAGTSTVVGPSPSETEMDTVPSTDPAPKPPAPEATAPASRVPRPATTTTAVAAPATAPATTTPNSPPTLSNLRLTSPGPMQQTCNAGNDVRIVEVTVTDDRGVSGVVLTWRAPDQSVGQVAMVRTGNRWRAQLGPFPTTGQAAYRTTATDTDGATATVGPQSVPVEVCLI